MEIITQHGYLPNQHLTAAFIDIHRDQFNCLLVTECNDELDPVKSWVYNAECWAAFYVTEQPTEQVTKLLEKRRAEYDGQVKLGQHL